MELLIWSFSHLDSSIIYSIVKSFKKVKNPPIVCRSDKTIGIFSDIKMLFSCLYLPKVNKSFVRRKKRQ